MDRRSIPTYVFHVLNSYDDGDAVVMDVVRYDRAFDTDPGQVIASGLPTLARWRIDLAEQRVFEQLLDDVPVEFPRIDGAVAGYPHRYGYCNRLGDRPEDPAPVGLIKYDLVRRRVDPFRTGRALLAGGAGVRSGRTTVTARTRAGS